MTCSISKRWLMVLYSMAAFSCWRRASSCSQTQIFDHGWCTACALVIVKAGSCYTSASNPEDILYHNPKHLILIHPALPHPPWPIGMNWKLSRKRPTKLSRNDPGPKPLKSFQPRAETTRFLQIILCRKPTVKNEDCRAAPMLCSGFFFLFLFLDGEGDFLSISK